VIEAEEVGEALDDVSLQVNQWQNEVIEVVEPCLNDMAELEDNPVEAETVILAGKLLIQVTDGDWKQAEGMAEVLQSYISETRSKGGEIVYVE